jgi:hypothetical protein
MTNLLLAVLLLVTWFPPAGVDDPPRIRLVGGEPHDLARLELALGRFEDAGLELPDLVVRVGDGICGGAMGRFVEAEPTWEVLICTDIDAVWEHELAHAWERHTLDEATRNAFMAAFGYDTWRGAAVPWRERAAEGVAFLVQQGLAGLPITSPPSPSAVERMDGYRLLTGRVPPTWDRDCLPVPVSA